MILLPLGLSVMLILAMDAQKELVIETLVTAHVHQEQTPSNIQRV
jgi:hypothetical protein